LQNCPNRHSPTDFLEEADFKDRRYKEAIVAYKKAIDIKPDYAEAYYEMGGAYCGLRQFQDAIATHKKAVAIKPDYAASGRWSSG